MKLVALRDFALVLPSAAAIGAVLAALQPAPFWKGWAGFSSLFVLGLLVLVLTVRGLGGGRSLFVVSVIALGLRLVIGTSLFAVLPIDGYDEPDDRAGHVFTDAHRRDDQAWDLADSDEPITSAFDRTFYSDQYGGLLGLSALTYRIFSPDAHRQLLILALAAIFAALGVPFFFAASSKLWDARLAAAATWLYCLYPESILTGGAQMREPFLLTCISIALWGFACWLQARLTQGWLWLGIGLGGLMLLSPGVALAMLVLIGVWIYVRGQQTTVGLWFWIGGGLLFVAGLLFLAGSLAAPSQGGGAPFAVILGWFTEAVEWVIYQLERGSGQVQNVFSQLFPAAQFLFVVAYGITQPLLPPAFLEPTTLTWHMVGVFRAVGWYAVLPLLAYAPFAIHRIREGTGRRVWAWLAAFSWLWIVLCAIRAGGDQWDNPRYRLIFFGVQALVAVKAWVCWRQERDAWLPRIVAAELICILLFAQWYAARYYLIGIHRPILVVMGLSAAATILILVGGALWDRLNPGRQASKQ